MTVPLSVLDLAPIGSGSTPSQALRATVELARLADRLGYTRYWFAEHHSLPSVASSAPEVLIEHVASATGRIRVGSGGIMLPNHVPLRVAETFQTLEALHPGRIDLGLGRAPGSDPATSRALRPFDGEQFPSLLAEMLSLSRREIPADHPLGSVRVIPDDVDLPPIWLLGSSGATARLAGSLGLGYSFASHFSPTPPEPAIRAYRENFEPSSQFPKPHAILAVAVVCAETEERAEYLAWSLNLSWVRLRTGRLGPLPTPEEAMAYPYTPQELAALREYRDLVIVGNPATVRARIEALLAEVEVEEVMVTTMVHSQEERLRSYELVAEAFGLEGPQGPQGLQGPKT
ncbi:MAG TPA: LLM class flavin-dependent oxidoreductase [Thermoanaerobaculia bacterium]|jgi:luciferase family oxidoreductase group 1|nr:LLM class flavin-dependent oxidoreductase [Thermoanaerobaculia bacterium]